MKTVTIEKTGEVVEMDSKLKRSVRWALGEEKGHYFLTTGMKKDKVTHLTDKQAELDFFRWASVLNEDIVMQIFKENHPKAGHLIGLNDCPTEDETNDEIHSVYEWGKELSTLESIELRTDSPDFERMLNIVRMLGDAKLIWRGCPRWWRTI